jgi:hypothetical protein
MCSSTNAPMAVCVSRSKNRYKSLLLILACSSVLPRHAAAQRQVDVDAVNRLIDQYGATEESPPTSTLPA